MNVFQKTESDPTLNDLVETLQSKLNKAMADNAKLLIVLDDRKRENAQLKDHIEALSLDLHCAGKNHPAERAKGGM